MSDLISRSKEEWKAIQGYEGIYEVSNFGNVRSLPRYKRGNFDSKVLIEGKTIKQVKNNRGYYIVQLSKNNKVKNFSVHRLVAEAFIPNPNNFPQVNHKDEDKSNNRVSNLEWMTLKRNINYGTRNKRMALTKGKNVKAFDDDGNFIMWFCSMTVAEKITGINQGDISRCTLGKTKHAGGYVWEIVKQESAEYEECYKDCGECEAYDKEKHHCPKFCKVIKETVKEIEENNNCWIPCSERLPEESGEYLTWVEYDGDRFIAIDEIDCDGIIKEWNCSTDYKIIAWQPLPQPYQPKGDHDENTN